MTVLLDEDLSTALAFRLRGHQVESVSSRGWQGVKNGKLLALVQEAAFEVFITADQNMSYQQPLGRYPFAVLVLSTNHWPTIRKNTQPIRDALGTVKPGETTLVDCGVFTPSKRRKHQDEGTSNSST